MLSHTPSVRKERRFNAARPAIDAWIKCGDAMDLPSMFEDGLLVFEMHAIAPRYVDYKSDDGYNNIFIGQHINGVPHGIVRLLNEYGRIYEGQMEYGKFHGFGRYIYQDGEQTFSIWNKGFVNGNTIEMYSFKNVTTNKFFIRGKGKSKRQSRHDPDWDYYFLRSYFPKDPKKFGDLFVTRLTEEKRLEIR